MSYVEGDREVQDWIHNASLVKVVDGDFHGTGKSYSPGWKGKCVLVKYSWQQSTKRPFINTLGSVCGSALPLGP